VAGIAVMTVTRAHGRRCSGVVGIEGPPVGRAGELQLGRGAERHEHLLGFEPALPSADRSPARIDRGDLRPHEVDAPTGQPGQPPRAVLQWPDTNQIPQFCVADEEAVTRRHQGDRAVGWQQAPQLVGSR